MTAYYNEFDPNAAAWLRQLIEMDLIAPGEVDERSITDVTAADLRGFTQHHFFAGIGVWSYSLRRAGWTDDLPVCTASLPCQPFSAAGKRKGKDDERHLLPHFLNLVKECDFPIIIGEQVPGAIKSGWIRGEDEGLHQMRQAEAYLRVLSELQRDGGETLYELQQESQRAETQEKGKVCIRVQGLEDDKPWLGAEECCCQQGQAERSGVGHNGRVGSAEDRRWIMRSHWDSVRSQYAEGLEYSIIGSDRQFDWVYEEQHESSYLCSECDEEHLGRSEDCRGFQWNPEQAEREINRVHDELRRKIEAKAQQGWLDDLYDEMEQQGYTCGSSVLTAAGAGAPHIRQRIYWTAARLAHTDGLRQQGKCGSGGEEERVAECGEIVGMANSDPAGQPTSQGRGQGYWHESGYNAGRCGKSGRMGDTEHNGHAASEKSGSNGKTVSECEAWQDGASESERAGPSRVIPAIIGGMGDTENANRWPEPQQPTSDSWESRHQSGGPGEHIEWLYCRDEKYRPIKSGIAPLVDGSARGMVHSGHNRIQEFSSLNSIQKQEIIQGANETSEARVMRLKGYGNAIQADVATEFISAVMECL
jgi:site-specific DNA-cytosine methylase